MNYGLIPDDPRDVIKCVFVSIAVAAFIFITPRVIGLFIHWMEAIG